MTDASEAVVNRYAYDSFGRVAGSEAVWNDLTFTGREYDLETGLLYLRARYYDPDAGRFVSKDPIGFAGGDVNLYGYVLGNPVNWVDPSGEFLFAVPLAVITVKVVAIGVAYGGFKVAQYIANHAGPENSCSVSVKEQNRAINQAFSNVAAINGVTVGAAGLIAGGVYTGMAVTPFVYAHPGLITNSAEFVEGAVVPGPPLNKPAGVVGSLTRYLYDKFNDIMTP